MENSGIITYRESDFLINENASQKMINAVFKIVFHEFTVSLNPSKLNIGTSFFYSSCSINISAT